MPRNWNLGPHTLEIEEGERQAILLALAHLAIERPGWDDMLREIAKKMDDDHLTLYHHFKAFSPKPRKRPDEASS